MIQPLLFQFAHLPMILSPEGGKISKRFGATAIKEYKSVAEEKEFRSVAKELGAEGARFSSPPCKGSAYRKAYRLGFI